jgi:type IV pilus assembly protein PilN
MINVNLLPPEIRAEIDQQKKNGQVMSVFWKLIALTLTYLLIFGGFYYYFYSSSRTLSSELGTKEEEVKKYGTLEEEAKKVAERLNIIKQIQGNTNVWSGVIDEVMNVVPSGVSLKSIKIDSSAKNRNQISGEAVSKTLVASLRDSLEKSDKFEYVDIETSMTAEDPTKTKELENFTISFSLEKGALK